MKIVRFIDAAGTTQFGSQHDDGSVTLLEGDIYGQYSDTGQAAQVDKLLAPIAPVDILCIGLNYKFHAEEGGMPIPEQPILFMKSTLFFYIFYGYKILTITLPTLVLF